MMQPVIRKNHMDIAWHEYTDENGADIPVTQASLTEKASIIGRVGIMFLSCGTGAWRVRSSMNTLAEIMGITCTADIGLMSIEYTCFDGEEGFTQSLCLTNTGVNTSKLNCLEHFIREFEIDGKTAVPINIENADEDSLFSVKLSSDATYRFKWAIGSKSYTLDKKTSGATRINTSYTIPKSWNEEIKNSTAGSCILSVQVLFGSQVYQSRDTAVRATVPDDCVPVINSISIADTKGRVPAAWGMFVEHNSNIAITAANITKSYGADIVSVNMELNDRTYYGTPSALPQSYMLEDYGIMDVTVKIRDTRGRTAEKTAKVTVVEYNPPTIQVDSMRCGQDGTLENEGTYFLATTDSTYSTCNGKNKATLQMQYKLSSQGAYTSAVKELPIGEATTVCGGDLNTEFSYDVRYVLKDTFNTVTVIDFVSTAVYAMHFLHGGRGVAFGSKATVENAVDFTFDAIFRHGVKFIKSDGSEVTMQQILNKLGL